METPKEFKARWDKAVIEKNFDMMAAMLEGKNNKLISSMLKNLALKVETRAYRFALGK